MKKGQKGEMEEVGMDVSLACEQWAKDPGTLAQTRSSKDVFH